MYTYRKKKRNTKNTLISTRKSHTINNNALPESISRPKIHLFSFNSSNVHEKTIDVDEISSALKDHSQHIWINVHGIHDTDLINKIGIAFNLHPLVIDDILNTEQRPKVDDFDAYIFLETRFFYYETNTMSVNSEQISMVLGNRFLLTFQEKPSGAFESIRERLRTTHTSMRDLGVDYLAYSLLDSIVDRYFSVLDEMNNASETLESKLLNNPSPIELNQIHQLKRASIELRRSVWPLREVINHLIRNENGFFHTTTIPYLRDVHDHIVSFIESLESIRDNLSGLMDIYMTSVSNRVNLELRALTVVAMLFMPATLIAGIFGMNFVHMPWIEHVNGFWWAIGIMGAIAVVMLLIFWRRQWLTSQN